MYTKKIGAPPSTKKPEMSKITNKQILVIIIEDMRKKLHKLVKGLSDQSVVQLSQQLDKYIFEYQHSRRNMEHDC